MSESLSGLYAQAEIVRIALASGNLDDLLETFENTIRSRKLAAAAEKAATLKVGDIVSLVNISPKYLAGQEVRVVGFDGNWVVGRLLFSIGRFSAGRDVRFRHSHVGGVRS